MGKNVCIMCMKERPGLTVRGDAILSALRWIKRNVTRNPKNYTLVVCKECFLDYKKKRDSYERKMVIYAVLGIIFLAAITVVSSSKLGAIAVGLVIMLFLFLIAQLSYIPGVNMPETKAKGKPKRRTG